MNQKKKNITLLQIAQLGHTVLRKETLPIQLVENLEIQTLIDNMIATCIDVNGVGIAAPQVYKSLQLFIVASRKNPRYPKAPNMKPLAMINAKLVSHGSEQTKDWEGCLSIPGIRGYVPRYEIITISYTTRTGKYIEKSLRGFVARIFQHEFDHINGKVFLDKLETNKDIISDKEYLKHITAQQKKSTKH